jgi:hypothetical protein
MKTIFSHPDSSRVGHAKSILEASGIICFMRNEISHNHIGGALVGPLKLFEPELVVYDDADYENAMELIRGWAQPSAAAPDWTCGACQEAVPGSMAQCWQCEVERPELC